MQAQIKRSNVYPFYKVEAEPTPAPVKRWKWNKAKAADNLRELVGMAAVAAFLTWLVVGWIEGKWL